MIQIGEKAPSFNAQAYFNGTFTNVSLENYKGKWVYLFFYGGDFTFVWASEVAAVAANIKEFEELGVQVLSCSVDSIYTHKVWNDQELSKMAGNTPFPMMSDQNGEIGKMYGVYDEQSGVSLRGTFIIDPEGILQSLEILSMPIGRNVFEGLRQIKAGQMVRNSKGKEVAPAVWDTGKKTIKPRPELVGNVWQEWNVNDI